MIKCNCCGYSERFERGICPRCSSVVAPTQDEINNALSETRTALSEKRYTDALRGYIILTDVGCTDAEREYAEILERGLLTPRDLNSAMKFFYRAATKNDPYSAYRYSRLVSRENDDTARFWLIFSAVLGCSAAYPVVAEEFSLCGYEEDAHYFYTLAAECDDIGSIVTLSKRYFEGIGAERSPEYAKWYMDKLKIPPIYAIKLAYKLRRERAKEPPAPTLKNYDGLLGRLAIQAKKCGFDTAYLKISEILSERGSTDATVTVGTALIKGEGCKQDFTKGLKLLTKAAAKGNADAYITLADAYRDGKYVERNIDFAVSYYKKCADLECAIAYERLGDLFYTGDGVERDVAVAEGYYMKAGNLGSLKGKDMSEKIVAERNAAYIKGTASKTQEDTFRYFAIAASMGHVRAYAALAECFEKGIGTKINRHGAYLLYKKAAELGLDEAYLPLGRCYADGFGTRLDYDKARMTFNRAVKCGVHGAPEALSALDAAYRKKLSYKAYSKAMRLISMKRFDDARYFLNRSADLKCPKAIYTLGCMYEFGMGVECDKNKAYDFYEQAYSLLFRDPRAEYKLTILRMLKRRDRIGDVF